MDSTSRDEAHGLPTGLHRVVREPLPDRMSSDYVYILNIVTSNELVLADAVARHGKGTRQLRKYQRLTEMTFPKMVISRKLVGSG